MPSSTTTSTPQTHYETLSLPSNRKDLTAQDIRLAYHRALLLHHPDKKIHPSNPTTTTVDAITTAYKTLINPTTRAEYDRSLLLFTPPSSSLNSSHNNKPSSYPGGLETVDLSDMGYDAQQAIWYRRCQRCGKGAAGGGGMYVITEEELELDAEYGETITGCQGCSLWLRVTFAVVDEDDG